MTARPFGLLLVAALTMLVATCGGGGGGPTSPSLEQTSAGQGDGTNDQGPGDGGGGLGEATECPTSGNPDKVLVCHVPPGNPDNAHDICIDDSAVTAHLAHGDYLGDHWMGEKDLFHDQSVRIPLIVYDPRPEADATRGTVSEALVEGIDLAPTFVDFFGAV